MKNIKFYLYGTELHILDTDTNIVKCFYLEYLTDELYLLYGIETIEGNFVNEYTKDEIIKDYKCVYSDDDENSEDICEKYYLEKINYEDILKYFCNYYDISKDELINKIIESGKHINYENGYELNKTNFIKYMQKWNI